MKTKNIFLLLTILFFMMAVASCTQSTEGAPPPSASATPTLRTTSASSTPVAASTLTISPTLMMIPTLPVEDARKRLLDLLSSNGNCRLPCLLGIVPGTSTYQEAQAILVPLSSLSDSTGFIPEGGTVSPNYVEEDFLLATNIGFNIDSLSDNQIVSRVGLRARQMKKTISTENGPGFEPIFDSSVFGNRMNYYMLHSVLTTYGRPDSVLLGTVSQIPPLDPFGGFHILLLYPEQGIMIEYTTQMYTSGPYVSGCPANAHIEMDLYPSEIQTLFTLAWKKQIVMIGL